MPSRSAPVHPWQSFTCASLTNAIAQTPYLGEHLLSWILLLVSLPLCAWVLSTVRDTNYDVENPTHVEDVTEGTIIGMSLPAGHVAGDHLHGDGDIKQSSDVKAGEGNTTD